MKLPMQVVFRNMEKVDWLEDSVSKHAEKLETFFAGIMSCRVIVEIPHKHHHRGNYYQVTVNLTVPGAEIVSNMQSSKHEAAKDINAVVRDAFDSARRQLEGYVQQKRVG